MKLPHTEEVPDELYEAARVSRFMADDQCGRWKLTHFTRTEEEYRQEVLRAQFDGAHPELQTVRVVPPGTYISLMRRMIHEEKIEAVEDQFGTRLIEELATANGRTVEQQIEHMCPPDRAWIPVMSDTPAEILEHDHALNNAEGVVVITGLGLGCLPHALLSKGDAIEHIHIIEIDPQVIRLTGRYLKKHPKVTIHKGSALDIHKFLKQGTPVDYVWHDIWTHISARNLDDAEAEHGISYRRLFELYDGWLDVADTGAWAYREATIARQKTDELIEQERAFRERVKALPHDEQVEELYHHVLKDKLKIGNTDPFGDRRVPDDFIRTMDPDGSLLRHLHTVVADPDFWPGYERQRAQRDATPDPLGRPNAHLDRSA